MTDSGAHDPRAPRAHQDHGGLHRAVDGIGEHGQLVPGPPWILGHRGAPHEAPENTVAGLERAVELGLDGFSYDLRSCATGELVLLADSTLERTTDGSGSLADKTLPELSRLDAGGWLDARFAGEPLALVEEALAVPGNHARSWPQHLIEVREPGLLPVLSRALSGRADRLSVRVASPHARVCADARDLGMSAMLLCRAATERELAIVRDEGFTACATWSGGWDGAPPEWPCERWSVGVDRPADLLEACRLGLNGFHTNVPRRALATRALAFLTPDDDGPFPLRVPELAMHPGTELGGHGEWCGRWQVEAALRNPLPFRVTASLEVIVDRGAFEVGDLPSELVLEPGQEVELRFELAGGAWEPGGDPALAARLRWREGPGRPESVLTLDAPLERVRTLSLGAGTQRIELLRERRGQAGASLTARRSGKDLLLAIEHAGGLADARVVCSMDGHQVFGSQGLRVALPEDFASRAGGVPFSAGLLGRTPGADRWTWRRWAGGVPDDLRAGAPGRLLSDART